MKTISAKAGEVKFYIETVGESVESLDSPSTGRKTIPTGATEGLKDLYEEIKILLKNIASDFGSTLNDINKDHQPKKAELKLGFAIDGKVKAWIVTCKSDASLNITFTWEK